MDADLSPVTPRNEPVSGRPRHADLQALHTAPIMGGMRLLRSHEVKNLLGYTDTGAFWAAVRAAGCPFIKINPRRIMFEEAAVRAWLERHTVGGRAGRRVSRLR